MPMMKTHPGKGLLDEMLARDLKLSELAALVDLDADVVHEILMEHLDVTPETAEHLGRLGAGSQYWLNLQTNYDNGDNTWVVEENELRTQWLVLHEKLHESANKIDREFQVFCYMSGNFVPYAPGVLKIEEGNRIAEALRTRINCPII